MERLDRNSHSSCARIRQLVGSTDQHRRGEPGLVDQPACTWDDIHVIKCKANFDISEDEKSWRERLRVFLQTVLRLGGERLRLPRYRLRLALVNIATDLPSIHRSCPSASEAYIRLRRSHQDRLGHFSATLDHGRVSVSRAIPQKLTGIRHCCG